MNILRRYQFNSILPSPSTPSFPQILSTSYEPALPVESNTIILNSSRLSFPVTPSSDSSLHFTSPGHLSDLDRVSNNYNPNAESLVSYQNPVQNLLPKLISLFASIPPPPSTETSSLTHPILSPTSNSTPSSTLLPTPPTSPFPDLNVRLPIQPLELSPESNEDILHLLLDYPTSTSQESIQNPYPLPICTSNLAPISKTPPLHSSRSTLPLIVDPKPLSTPYDSPQQLLHFLLNSSSMEINRLNSALSDYNSRLNSNSPQTITRQSSTTKSNLNPAFIKYLTTLPLSVT